MPKVLDDAGLGLKDVDVFEFHEAFAVSISYLIDLMYSFLHSPLCYIMISLVRGQWI